MIDLAIGFTVGAAFSTIAKSLVDDIIMPPIGLALGRVDFSDLYFVLRPGKTPLDGVSTLQDAQASGAVTINYGLFLNHLLTFIIVALTMFLIIRLINRFESQLESQLVGGKKDTPEPDNKKCRFCYSTIPYKATRCPQCTSQLAENGGS